MANTIEGTTSNLHNSKGVLSGRCDRF